MKNKKQETSRKANPIIAVVLAVVLFIPCVVFFLHLKDHKLLRESEYNSVFLSMFPVDTFNEEDFAHFRGDTVLLYPHEISGYFFLKHDLKDVRASGNEIRVLYLGVDPEKIKPEQILEFTAWFPETEINVIPLYRPIQDWVSMKDPSKTLEAYRTLVDGLTDLENIHVYSFFTQEWLIADPSNYLDGSRLCEEAARLVYIYTDTLHHCNLTSEDTDRYFTDLEQLISIAQNGPETFPDLSDTDIVFFGDSVIGSYTDKYSIPQYVTAFSGARTYNCGLGGAIGCGENPGDLPGLMSAYLSGNASLLPEDTQVRAGVEARLADEPASDRKLIYVLHYGLNDYFQGKPVSGIDPLDVTTFAGSVRSAVKQLKKAHPEARILLFVPNAVACYKKGKLVMGEKGSPFIEYVKAIRQIAEEESVMIADNYLDVIPPEETDRYLVDEVHPNEAGRYRIARYLLRRLAYYEQ